MKKKSLNRLHFKKTIISHATGRFTGGLEVGPSGPTVLATANCPSRLGCTFTCSVQVACPSLACDQTLQGCAPLSNIC
ncbi:hypothetical protein [Ascidiimonas aurantiaca]|uniref:hypothetical protein n=1 Tax=Ascidiimonas aurantiaca TaxID=1685432 RepID=UPI0030EF9FD2